MALNDRKIDTDVLRRQLKYVKNGLTVTSNNVNIHPRDIAGNIILQEKSETNPLLIIEPVTTKISTKSMLRVLDTQFDYFKFPVTTPLTDVPDVNLDTELLDIIYARYSPSANTVVPIVNSGLLFDVVEEGLPPQNANAYTITKDIKDLNRNLRFRIKITHKFDFEAPSTTHGTVYFYLYRNGPNRAGLDREFNKIISGVDAYANTLENFPPQITQDGYGEIIYGTTQTLLLDLIIPTSEYEIGDTFALGALAGQQDLHTIISDQTYWVISDASKNVDLWNQPIE
jgi:hypothetical protein